MSLALTALVPAFVLAQPAVAQDKKASIRAQKVLLDNDRMRAMKEKVTQRVSAGAPLAWRQA